MTYKQGVRKFKLEKVFMSPFVLLGKLYGRLFPLRTKHNLFLFFPNADVGGAPKVNIDIVRCVKDQQPLIIFTKKPKNNAFKELFQIEGVRIIDLHKRIDNKLFHFVNFFYRGVISSWVSQSKTPVIFGGECVFFYKMIPHLKPGVKRIELSHLDTWLPYNIGHIDRIDLRIFSTAYLKRKVEAQYAENNISRQLYDRLQFIDNTLPIPTQKPPVSNSKLEVVFIGRGSAQKRVHLIAAIAEAMYKSGDPVHFSFVGDVEKVIDTDQYPYCTFHGIINDQAIINSIYENSDVLLLTSAFEGLPIVVMQMMAYGKVVVSTAVNGIPDYIKHMGNGLLITAKEENKIIEAGIQCLRQLIREPLLKEQLGKRSREIAIEKFSEENFARTYQKLLCDAP